MPISNIQYNATNVATEFHFDNHFVRLLLGPVGCGKTVACCEEPLILGAMQAPNKDGVRRTRGAVVRNTYPDLKSTTIKTWSEWYPEEKFGRIKYDSPITQLIKFRNGDGFDIEIDVIFLALDNEADIRKLRSGEFTWIYVNELQYIHKSIFKVCCERVNRFPKKADGAPITKTGVFADTNPPDADHWIYKLFEEQKPTNHKIFKYVPPLLKISDAPKDGTQHAISLSGSIYINNPDCDYRHIQNDPDYWIKLVPGYTDEEIKVNIMGEYGIIINGKPVHPTYNDNLHFANKILQPSEQIEIGLGWDFGLTPACAIVQLTARGQLQVLDELWSEDMGLRDFASNIVIPHLDRHYPFWRKNYVSVHDPAGSTGSQTDGRNCEDILRELDIKSRPAADNNNPTPRRDGLKYFLGKMVDGMPAFIVSMKGQRIRKGLMGAFQYARIRASGDERFHEKPLKNMYSHICEALEYIAMHYSAEHKRPPPSEEKPYRIHRGSFMSM